MKETALSAIITHKKQREPEPGILIALMPVSLREKASNDLFPNSNIAKMSYRNF
ncbi:MAG: hypothetical protein AAGF45_12270 [Pseudomonadota bacterium]